MQCIFPTSLKSCLPHVRQGTKKIVIDTVTVTIIMIQCWKLALARLPMQVLKVSGKCKLSIAHPFGKYDFHVWNY